MITKVDAKTDEETINLNNTEQDTWEGDVERNEAEVYPFEITAYSDSGNSTTVEKTFSFGTGYVSEAVSDENGTFAENPAIALTLEAKYKCFGIKIKFAGNLPKKFIIKTQPKLKINPLNTMTAKCDCRPFYNSIEL